METLLILFAKLIIVLLVVGILFIALKKIPGLPPIAIQIIEVLLLVFVALFILVAGWDLVSGGFNGHLLRN